MSNAPTESRTVDPELIRFIDHARGKGMDHATIRQLLLSAGWRDGDVAEAFCTHDLELPIPQPPRGSSVRAVGARRAGSPWPRRARDAFLHLLAFGALYGWATSLILLFFTYINFALPDPAWRVSYTRLEQILSVVRAELAVVIVAYPIFLIVWHFLLREVRRDPEKAKGAIRRWLIYLSLFVGAITLSADVVTLIYFALEGELTARLLLKTAVLFLIAGSLVLYLAYTVRSETDAER